MLRSIKWLRLTPFTAFKVQRQTFAPMLRPFPGAGDS